MLPDQDFFTPQELAVRWKCSVETVHRRLRSGQLPSIHMGGYRVPREAVELFESCESVGRLRRDRREVSPKRKRTGVSPRVSRILERKKS